MYENNKTDKSDHPNKPGYLKTDQKKKNFVHLTTKIVAGRDLEIPQDAADRIFKTLTEFLQLIYDSRYLSIGFELIELHPKLIYKKNNIENKFE